MSTGLVFEFSVATSYKADGPIFPKAQKFRVLVESHGVRAYLETQDDFGGLRWTQLAPVDGDPLSADAIIALAIFGYIATVTSSIAANGAPDPVGHRVIDIGTLNMENCPAGRTVTRRNAANNEAALADVPARSALVRVARGIGLSDLGAVPEEMADTCLKVIALERDLAGAIRRDLTAARADSEQLRKMMFANDRVLFDGRPARTRSCSACHVGAVPDPYSLAPLDVAVKDAPVTAVMAIAVGSVDIFETTREARELADRARRPVAFDCQGFTVVVNPDEDPEAVARAWWWTRHGETPEQSAARR